MGIEVVLDNVVCDQVGDAFIYHCFSALVMTFVLYRYKNTPPRITLNKPRGYPMSILRGVVHL